MTEALGLPDPGRGGALAGLVIVELAETPAGELAGGLLADLGATVVKIEPRGGSPMRRRGPGLDGEDSLAFQSENRGKHSVQAELEELATEPWLARLLASADALIEDLGPGRLEAAGLSPEALERRNPRLVTLRISPFGQTGPLAAERGDDRIAQAFSGVQFTTGFPDRAPLPVTVPLAESWTAIHGASGLLMAIFHARRSGRGQVVDLGLYQTALRMQEEVVVRHDRSGAVAERLGTESPIVVPANVYRTRDGGWIAVSGAGDQPFARLCEAIEAPDAPKDPALRHARRASPEPAGLRRAGRLLDRPARPRRRRGALREGRRGRHRGALRRRHHRGRAREGARGHPAAHVGDGAGLPRARAGAEAHADAGPEPAARPEGRRAHRGRAGGARADRGPDASRRAATGIRVGRRVGSPAWRPRARPLAVAGGPGGGRPARRLRRRRDHGRAAERGRGRAGPQEPGVRGHQPQQAQHHARRARPRRPRGVSRPWRA